MWGPMYWPDGYVPEEYGWELAAEPKEDFAAVMPRVWLRWQIPFKGPQALAEILHEGRGVRGLTYMGPIDGLFPEQASGRQLYEELLRRY